MAYLNTRFHDLKQTVKVEVFGFKGARPKNQLRSEVAFRAKTILFQRKISNFFLPDFLALKGVFDGYV